MGTTIKQKNLSMRFMVIWLMIINTVQWITLDMYLPALPVITEEFGVSESYLNLTVNVGMIACAIGVFLGGTLSDRFGRKPPLLLGLAGGAAGSFISMFAMNVPVLAAARGITLFGGGIALSIIMAIIRDSFEGEEFNRVTSIQQAIAATGPVFAPTLGSLMINIGSWRYIFALLGVLTLITLIPMLRLTETWPKERRVAEDMKAILAQAARFARDKSFMTFMIVLSCATIPMWAYVGVSSYVYINEFGLSNTVYGVFYAISALMSLSGPFIYMGLGRIINVRRIVNLSLVLMGISGLMMIVTGRLMPLLFLIGSSPCIIAEGIMRPLTAVVVLEEHPDDAGTASSWMQFIGNMVGVIGTTLATLSWTSMATGVGVITAGCTVIGAAAWIAMLRKKMMKAFC